MENTENLRIPPQNIEAEQALLGAILSNNKALEKVSDFLTFVKHIHSNAVYTDCICAYCTFCA